MQSGETFEQITFGMMNGGSDDLVCLPFYRIGADISGLELLSYADLIRFANLPRVAGETSGAMPFYFWSPAFKIRPQDMLRFAGVTIVPRNYFLAYLPFQVRGNELYQSQFNLRLNKNLLAYAENL